MAGKGRAPFVPTDEQRKQVEALSGYGLPHEQIASVIGCSQDTLVKYFSQELAEGMAKANSRVAQFLYQQATKNLTAAIFWAKTRMRWRETDRLEVTGKDGEDLIPKLVINLKKTDGK